MARRQRAPSSFTHDRQHPEKATKIETTSFEDDKDDDVYIWAALVVPGYCNRIYRLLDALIHTYLLTYLHTMARENIPSVKRFMRYLVPRIIRSLTFQKRI